LRKQIISDFILTALPTTINSDGHDLPFGGQQSSGKDRDVTLACDEGWRAQKMKWQLGAKEFYIFTTRLLKWTKKAIWGRTQ
jgi:hypothetical protein